MTNDINWNFDNTYFKLPESFREIIKPIKVKNPSLILLNKSLAKYLDLDFSNLNQSELSAVFTGKGEYELPKLKLSTLIPVSPGARPLVPFEFV